MIFKMALMNVFRQKRRSLLTLLTMFGGFTLAAVSIGWSDGSYSYIINMFTRNRLGHIQLHAKGYVEKPSLYDAINEYTAVGAKVVKVKGVAAWAPRVYGAGLISFGEKSAGVRITGIDPGLEDTATNFNRKILPGGIFPARVSHRVLLGKELSAVLRAKQGDKIVLVSQAADGSIANDLYEVSGIIDTGDPVSGRISCYLNILDAQEFFALGTRAHEIIVIADSIKQVKPLARAITLEINDPSIIVETWQQFAKTFYQAMKADQQGMWIMLVIITLIVAVGVLNTVLMSVLERRREYGLLKALGATPQSIAALILFEVNILAAVSVLAGCGAGLLLNYLFSIKGISMPTTFTYGGVEFSKMYTEVNARSFYMPAVTVMLTATLVSLLPALKAARVNPAKAMRTH